MFRPSVWIITDEFRLTICTCILKLICKANGDCPIRRKNPEDQKTTVLWGFRCSSQSDTSSNSKDSTKFTDSCPSSCDNDGMPPWDYSDSKHHYMKRFSNSLVRYRWLFITEIKQWKKVIHNKINALICNLRLFKYVSLQFICKFICLESSILTWYNYIVT